MPTQLSKRPENRFFASENGQIYLPHFKAITFENMTYSKQSNKAKYKTSLCLRVASGSVAPHSLTLSVTQFTTLVKIASFAVCLHCLGVGGGG